MKKIPIEKKKKWLAIVSLFCMLWFVVFFAWSLEYFASQLDKSRAIAYGVTSLILAAIGGTCWTAMIKEDDHD